MLFTLEGFLPVLRMLLSFLDPLVKRLPRYASQKACIFLEQPFAYVTEYLVHSCLRALVIVLALLSRVEVSELINMVKYRKDSFGVKKGRRGVFFVMTSATFRPYNAEFSRIRANDLVTPCMGGIGSLSVRNS